MKSITSAFVVTAILVNGLILAFDIQPVQTLGTIYIRADGSIDPPTPRITTTDNVIYTFNDDISDSIVVERDHIVIDGTTHTLQGPGTFESCGIDLTETANVTVQSIHITNFGYGICLNSSVNNTVSGNTITGNSEGIRLEFSLGNSLSENNITGNVGGIGLRYSSGNAISGNTITDHSDGVWLHLSSANSITGNTVAASSYNGVKFYNSSGNTVSGNTITASGHGIDLCVSDSNVLGGNSIASNDWGVYLYSGSFNNSISGNTITASAYSGIFAASSSSNTVSGNTLTNNDRGIWLYSYANYNSVSENNVTASNEYGILLDECIQGNNTVSGNTVTGVEVGTTGVGLHTSSRNSISGNTVTANAYGFWFGGSSYNTVSGNTIAANGIGISLLSSSTSNTFYHNSFDNIHQVEAAGPGNIWDIGYPSGGNYWSDYSGSDEKSGPNQDQSGGDGIGDEPYNVVIDSQDRFPLVRPGTPSTESGIMNKEGVDYLIHVTSNATTLSFQYTCAFGRVWLSVAGESGSTAYVRVVQPVGLNSSNIRVFLDYDTELSFPSIDPPRSLSTNGTHYFIYVTVTFNSVRDLLVTFPLGGDVDYDGDVDIYDIVRVAGVYGVEIPDPRYDPHCDIDGDGDIDIYDIVIAAGNYGESW